MKNIPLENASPLHYFTTSPRHHFTTSLIAIAPSTKVGIVAIEGIDVQRKLRRRRFSSTAAREVECGNRCRCVYTCNLYRMVR